ncbi:hypothetical protein F4805DRAFT_227545 [Annulohypoxylon moriforme]|nr:hypothetical protein F4805DRAFT_227545 [Annulohypoxylon moriforme]
MSSFCWSHPLRIARPYGLLPRTRTQIRLNKLSRVPPLSYGQRPGVRSFSVASGAATVVQTTVDAIINIHATTHMPWFLLIPCLSIGFNLLFRLPSYYYTQKINQRQTKSYLVMQGWGWRIPQVIQKEGIPRNQGEKETRKRMKKITSRINRALGTQQWKLYSSVLTIPIWLIGIESIRQICGGPRGLLGNLIMGRLKKEPTATNAQQGVETAGLSADISSTATSQGSTADPSITSIVPEQGWNILDPSIVSEGCLWFPDLSVADPYHILPLALSAVLVANMLPKGGVLGLLNLSKPKDASTIAGTPNKWQLRLRRGGVLIALFVGPATMDMPAALHFYWLTSTTMSFVMNKALSYYMPIKTRRVERCNGVEATIIQPRPHRKDVPPKNTEQTNSKQ